MRSKLGAALTGLAVITSTLAVTATLAAPAGAVDGSFAATCVGTGGPSGPITSYRTVAYEVHAPDSVAPATTVDVAITIGYAIPPNAQLGGATFDVSGASSSVATISAPPGASEVSGTLSLSPTGGIGSVVEVRLRELFAGAEISGHLFADRCTPTHRLVVARIGVGVPAVSIGDAAVVEGSSGTRALQFAVSLSRPAATGVTVAFDTEDGTATAGSDYAAQSGTVTVPAGFVSLAATITLRVRGDQTVESKENLRIRLHDPVGAVLGRAVGTGRIIDDDPEPGPRISIGDGSVVEGVRAVRSARFVVSLSEPATQQIRFHYRTVDGSAVGGSDFEPQESDYFIPAGKSSITVPVPVVPDSTPEANESFTVRVTTADAVIGRANGVGTIFDDD